MRYGLSIHRKEQWDLNRTADVIPLICVHYKTLDHCKRVFCLWRMGILIGPFLLTPRLLQVGRWVVRWGKPDEQSKKKYL